MSLRCFSQRGRVLERTNREDSEHKAVAALAVAAAVAGGCASVNTEAARVATQPTTAAVAHDCTSSTTDQAVCMPASWLSLNALPLGTGKASTSPEQGYEFVCQAPNGNQPVVLDQEGRRRGGVRWHKKFTKSHRGSQGVLVGNGLPPRSGTFPPVIQRPGPRLQPRPDDHQRTPS
ncbi:MAG TPA: hypothetical protein VLX59_12875 [Acidimicrobiales bacterium]|nr:hypothetical protein [Acidimicrobiales bacterium]